MSSTSELIGRRFMDEVATQASEPAIDELVAEDIIYTSSGYPDIVGRAEFKDFIAEHHVAQPDLHYSIEDVIATDDQVVVRWTSYGTQEGVMLGSPQQPSDRHSGDKHLQRRARANRARLHDLGRPGRQYADGSRGNRMTGRDHPDEPRRSSRPKPRPQGPQSAHDPRAVVQRFFHEFVDVGNLSCIPDLIDENYVGHFPGMPTVRGRDEFHALMTMYNNGFSARAMEINDTIVEEDKIAVRSTFRATHTGTVANVPATNRPVVVCEISIFLIPRTTIAEQWVSEDD